MSDSDLSDNTYNIGSASDLYDINNGPGGISDAARRRVDHITLTTELTGTRCLIENTHQSNHVEYAHCLKRATNKYSARVSMEYGPTYFECDTRYNIFRLSVKFHEAFDSGKWLLLPETGIIETYYNAKDVTSSFPKIDDNVYKYTLVAHPDMEDIPIHRQVDPVHLSPGKLRASDFTFYAHPYLDFPVINSHVHPRFVICNSGSKLNDLGTWTKDYNSPLHKNLLKVQAIWMTWKETKPTDSFFKKINDNDDSHKTTPRHISKSTRPLKRTAPQDQDSLTPKSSKQRKLEDGVAWLDDETLHQLKQQTSKSQLIPDKFRSRRRL